MTLSFKRFTLDESAATAIEYGLIAAGIAVANIVGGVPLPGPGSRKRSRFASPPFGLRSLTQDHRSHNSSVRYNFAMDDTKMQEGFSLLETLAVVRSA